MTEIAKTLTLQEKVSERIKRDIGDLIEPEDLKRLVEQAMQDAFFKPRTVKTDSYGRGEVVPPLVVETVRDLMKKGVDEAIAGWFVEHNEEVTKMLRETVDAGVVKAVMAAFDNKVQGDLWSFGNALSQRMIGKPL